MEIRVKICLSEQKLIRFGFQLQFDHEHLIFFP